MCISVRVLWISVLYMYVYVYDMYSINMLYRCMSMQTYFAQANQRGDRGLALGSPGVGHSRTQHAFGARVPQLDGPVLPA